jgi:flagella basal body P-ring formation protein FlgA
MTKTSLNHGFLTAVFFTVAFVSTAQSSAHADAWQSLESIKRAATAYAESRLATPDSRLRATVKALDERLRLARCAEPLTTFMPDHTTQLRRNATVGVRCSRPKPWKIYVPVVIAAYRPVLVTNRPIARGEILTPGDVRIDERDVATVRSAYLTDVIQLSGKVVRRALPEGTLITIGHLNEERIVKRGQSVTLLINHSGLQVRMAGTALSDGIRNQRIEVENHSSKRIVEGIVRSQQLVEVVL